MVIRVTRNSGSTWHLALVPDEDEPILDELLRDETISAAIPSAQYAIQTTHEEARVLSRPALACVESLSFPEPLLAAATDSYFDLLVVAHREKADTFLRVIHTSAKGFGAELRLQLQCDPTCVELLNINGAPHVFVGIIDSSLNIFRVGETDLQHVWASTLRNNSSSSGMAAVCESAIILTSGPRQVLACGTREGILATFSVEHSGAGK